MGRLVTVGAFPLTPPLIPTIPSFWGINLPTIRAQFLTQTTHDPKSISIFDKGFNASLLPLPLSQQLVAVNSLLSHLNLTIEKDGRRTSLGLSSEQAVRQVVKQEAALVRYIIGDINETRESSKASSFNRRDVSPDAKESSEEEKDDGQLRLWSQLSALLGRSLPLEIIRVIVCWADCSEQRGRGQCLATHYPLSRFLLTSFLRICPQC